jgi:hypothetical protein
MEIKYIGTRTKHGCEVVKEVDGLPAGELPLRLDLWNHSPSGYVEFAVIPAFPRILR